MGMGQKPFPTLYRMWLMVAREAKASVPRASDSALMAKKGPEGADYFCRLVAAGLLDRSSSQPDRLVIAVKRKG